GRGGHGDSACARAGGNGMPALDVTDISVRFGGITALDRASFSIDQGQICGLIGPNGAGKTTLFNVISRIYDPTSGQITFEGTDVLRARPHQISNLGIFRTFQNLALWPGLTLLENVMSVAHSKMKANIVSAPVRLGTRREERRTSVRCFELLQRLGLGEVAFQPAAGLPFGTLKRVEIARALAGDPKMLMLDEPAGGLTHSEVD